MAQSTSGLLNILGTPNTSIFATFAYCASSHKDADDSATAGWVIDRSHDIRS